LANSTWIGLVVTAVEIIGFESMCEYVASYYLQFSIKWTVEIMFAFDACPSLCSGLVSQTSGRHYCYAQCYRLQIWQACFQDRLDIHSDGWHN